MQSSVHAGLPEPFLLLEQVAVAANPCSVIVAFVIGEVRLGITPSGIMTKFCISVQGTIWVAR